MLPLILLVLLMAGCATTPPSGPPPAANAEQRLRADLFFLADDALEGRGTPSRGLDTAALYLETQLRLAGVRPGLPDGYRQSYRIGEYAPAQARLSLKIAGRAIASSDYVFLNFGRDPARGPIELELVHAGFGVVAEEKKVNDLEGLSVRGKAIIAQKGASWPLEPGAVFGWDRAMGKLLAAAARGAELLVYVSPDLDKPGDSEAGFFAQMRNAPVGFVREAGLGPGGQPASALNPILIIKPAALGAALGTDLAKLPRGPLGKKVEIQIQAQVADGRASNVLGRIEGTDPAMRDQWIVLTAHYDHLGSHAAPAGQDGIWNGADDNASGTTVVLEMARRLAAQPGRRSVLVFFTSGEDRGIFGSAVYALRPAVPVDKTLVNINVDMVGRSEGKVQGIADGTPALFQKAIELGAQHGVQVIPDQQPHWRISYLTDCYHFLRLGVPAIEFFTGLHPDYHQPSDTADKIRYAEMSKILEVTTDLTRFYADGGARPEFRRPEWFLTP
jgi:surface antigen